MPVEYLATQDVIVTCEGYTPSTGLPDTGRGTAGAADFRAVIELVLPGHADNGKILDWNNDGAPSYAWEAIGDVTVFPVLTEISAIATYKFAVPAASLTGYEGATVRIIKASDDLAAIESATIAGASFTDAIVVSQTLEQRIVALGQISSTGSATNKEPSSFDITTGTPTGTYANVALKDGVYHQLADVGGVVDGYWEYNVGGAGVPTEVSFDGRLNSSNDEVTFYARNWVSSLWDQIHVLSGVNTTVDVAFSELLLNRHVGTGSDIGKVRIRVNGTGLTSSNLYVDRLLVSFSTAASSTGYANGAIWVDSAGTSGTEVGVNGVAENPCPFADALVINAALPLNRFQIASANTVTLSASAEAFTFFGEGWDLELGGQVITGMSASGAHVAGIATDGSERPHFRGCSFGAVTLPPSEFHDCGFGIDGGVFTAGADGDFVMHGCYSQVPGSGSPSFVFTGLGSATGINNRAWTGGATWTLDSDCTLSHEPLAGGGTTVTTGGANVEIRGITRSVTLVLSGAGTVQFVGTTGPITISGTATTTVNLYGVSAGVTDTSSGTAVTDLTVSRDNINVEADTAISDASLPTAEQINTNLETTNSHGAGSWAATVGGGAFGIVISTQESDTTPIANVQVSVYTNAARTAEFASVNTGVTGTADSFGIVAGTYYWAAAKAGVVFVSGSFVITATSTPTLTGTVQVPPAAAAPDECAVYGDLTSINAAQSKIVTAQGEGAQTVDDYVVTQDRDSDTANANGRWTINCKRGINVRFELPDTMQSGVYLIPDQASVNFADLVKVRG